MLVVGGASLIVSLGVGFATAARTAPVLCQVRPVGSAPVTVLTAQQLASALHGQPMMLASAAVNTVPAPAPGATGPGSDAPGSAASCQWTGSRVAPVAPYFFKYDIVVTLSVVPYPTPALAQAAYEFQLRQNRRFAGSASIPPVRGVGEAFLAGPGPQDGNAVLVVRTDSFVFGVTVTATPKLFAQTPWISVANAVLTGLSSATTVTTTTAAAAAGPVGLPFAPGERATLVAGPHENNEHWCGPDATAPTWTEERARSDLTKNDEACNSLDFLPLTGHVAAAASGTVMRVPRACAPALVVIKHANGWYTGYYHLQNIQVHSPETVREGQWIGDVARTSAAATPCGGSWSAPHVHFFLKHTTAASAGDPFQNVQPDVDLQDVILGGWKVTKTTPTEGCMTYLATGESQCSPRGVVTNYPTAPTPTGTSVTTSTTTTTAATTTTQRPTSPAAAVVRTFFAALARNDFNGAAQAILPQQRSCFLGDYTTFPVHVTLTSVQIGATTQTASTAATVEVKLSGNAKTPYGSPAFPSGAMRTAATGGRWYVDYEHSVIFQGPCLR